MKLRFFLAAALLAVSAACSSPVAPTLQAPTSSHRDGNPSDTTTTRSNDSTYGMGSGN